MALENRPKVVRLIHILFWSIFVLIVLGWLLMIRMPGKSFNGTALPLTSKERELRAEMIAHVQKLGGAIGERNLGHYPQLEMAAHYIESDLTRSGWKVRRDEYEVQAQSCYNLEAELPGASPEIVLIGAHYDSVFGSPGANDNGSGGAALLALARRFAQKSAQHTLRFVAFVNEEPPYFLTEQMGSLVYAGRCKARGDQISALLSLETIGYFSDMPHSQTYPSLGLGIFYP